MVKWLIVAGGLLILVGVLLQVAPGTINWFGKLPGDIRWESGNSRVFIPITSMIIVSLILTVIINLLKR